MNLILYLYVTIIMLIKNISTELFEVELLLFKDDLTVESYENYEKRNGAENNNFYVNFKTGIPCFIAIDLSQCYRKNTEGKLILNKDDMNKNEKFIKMKTKKPTNLQSKLKAIDLNERGIKKNDAFKYSRQKKLLKTAYYRYNLYPYYKESINDYWRRARDLLISCINRNSLLLMKEQRVNDICNMNNFDWYDNLKLFKPSVNETLESYQMRMAKYDRRPLMDSIFKKFYYIINPKRNPRNSIKSPNNFHEHFEDNFLQCIALCTLPDEDQDSSSLSQHYTCTTPNFNESSNYPNDNINTSNMNQHSLNTSNEHRKHLQGISNIMYKDDTTPHLDVDVGSSYQHENIPYTTATMDEDPSSLYRHSNPDYMSQNILDITREHHKGADIMYSTNDYPHNLFESSSYQYQNFNSNQNILDTSRQYWYHPEETPNIDNIDDTTPTYNFDEDFIQQQILDGNNSLQNNLDDFLNEEVDLDEITNIISSIDEIIPDRKK